MPGLAGFTSRQSSKDREHILRHMRALLTHRSFYEQDPLFCLDDVCSTRTHTNIIQTGEQPAHLDGVYVWLDGELFNQDELTPLLDVQPADPDPELLGQLYHQQPDFSFLDKIDGIYAAVIYDQNRKQVHLITDRYGLTHLYWTIRQNQLAWASELKGFVALPDLTPSIDRRAVRDFFDVGYLLGDKTWFKDVELVPPGTIITWNLDSHEVAEKRYWRWNRIKRLSGRLDEDEIADELGRRFIKAVKRRSDPKKRMGLGLSGGLDSRAILAAIPQEVEPVHAITYGQRNSRDVQIASAAARVRGAKHELFEINEQNWLHPRIEAVWWTDGQFNLRHMHSINVNCQMRELYDLNLNGFLGDAVMGTYLMRRGFSEHELFDNRGRRFIRMGPRLADIFIHSRLPFMDNAFVDLAMALPPRMRRHERVYKQMLLRTFPDYFTDIPWQKTGLPISHPEIIQRTASVIQKGKQKAHQLFGRFLPHHQSSDATYHDYPRWIRQDHARSIFRQLLLSPDARYPQYLSREQVKQTFEEHLAGKDHADRLCKYVTFEVWLRQVFDEQFRSRHEVVEQLTGR